MAETFTALVTGASSGIGLEIARCLADRGYALVLTARREERLQTEARALQTRTGRPVEVIAADLSQPQAARALAEEVRRRGCRIDVLVNNAGFGTHGFFWETSADTTDAMMAVNIAALTRLTREFLPDMVERRSGRILNVASLAAFQPGPLMAAYYASKAYVLSLSEALANELSGTGVTVTALCPGPTESGFQAAAGMGRVPLFASRRLPTSRDVARYGCRAMERGQRVALPGLTLRLAALAAKLAPRRVSASLARKIQSERR